MSADRAVKEPCRVATAGNIPLSGVQTVDGAALAVGDRVLVRAQDDALDNGIWQVAAGTWQRADDFDGADDVFGGAQVLVAAGAALAGSHWRVVGAGSFSVGNQPILFALMNDGAVAPAFAAPSGSSLIGHIAVGGGAAARTSSRSCATVRCR